MSQNVGDRVAGTTKYPGKIRDFRRLNIHGANVDRDRETTALASIRGSELS